MMGRPRSLQRADGEPFALAAIVGALGAEFTAAAGVSRLERRTRLDTFDGRLRAARLALEHRVDAAAARLELVLADATMIEAPTGRGLRWPAFTAVLPAGPVRDAVAPVAGIRALVAVSAERRLLRRVDLRNVDGKIVARVELDEPAPPGQAPGRSPAQLRVYPLRGYDGEARRAVRLLQGAGLGWLEPASPAAVGRPPRPGGDPAEAAPVLLARALTGFLATMRANLPGVLDDVDTEFLHDFRVALRRTRATLKLGRPVLGAAFSTRWEPALGWLGEVTAPGRDLDVYLLGLPAMAAWLVAADAADLELFAEHLGRRRAADRDELVRTLRSVRFRRLIRDWDEELTRLATGPVGAPGQIRSAGELAKQASSGAYRRVVRGGAAITRISPAVDLHRLRSRCKELRYALEVFAPLIEAGARTRIVADLTALQDVLGRFQDSQVQRDALGVFAGEMMAQGTTAAALLAMGELIGHLDADQRRARTEFEGVFARFAARSTDWRRDALGGAG